MRSVVGLEAQGDERHVMLSDGHHVRSRVVVLACGVDYRALDARPRAADRARRVLRRARLGGALHGGPTGVRHRRGQPAGQAALHLAKFAKQVTLLVRGAGLAVSMSDYLIEQIRSTRNVDIIHRAAVVGGAQVDDCLASIEVRHLDADRTEVLEAGGLFVLIGSGSAHGLARRDGAARRGRVPGHRPSVDKAETADPERLPQSLETSLPGVFAIGDAGGDRSSGWPAVGDGASAVQQLHTYLTDTDERAAAR
jgi:thioredoxin reductase (NADPH)